jgi:poly(A) polymerase
MHLAGLLQEVIPEVGNMEGVPQSEPHEHDVLEHSIMTMYWAGRVMGDLGKYFKGLAGDVSRYLDAQVDGPLAMSGLVKLCALLHDTGKPATYTTEPDRIRFTGHDLEGEAINAGIAGRLRLSGRAAHTLGMVTRAHLRPLHLTKGQVTRHAVYRYVRDVGEDLPASLIVALADALATRERPGAASTDVEGLAVEVAGYYYGEYRKMKAEPLITGNDLIDILGLEPGPLFGVILADVEEKRVEGAVTDKEGALRYVRENYPGGSLPG